MTFIIKGSVLLANMTNGRCYRKNTTFLLEVPVSFVMDTLHEARRRQHFPSFDRRLTWTSNKSQTFLPGHDLVLFYLAFWASPPFLSVDILQSIIICGPPFSLFGPLQVLEPDLCHGAQPVQMLCSHQCFNSLLWAMSFSALSELTLKSLDMIRLHCQFFACIRCCTFRTCEDVLCTPSTSAPATAARAWRRIGRD